MKKKKILILPPDTPHFSYIQTVVSPLSFLEDNYILDTLDSLTFMEDTPNDVFYNLWKQELIKYIPHYDAFFGFSFGGVILQQCFSLFESLKKPIILFSTPTFANAPLREKLTEVISLCKINKVNEALQLLYQHVYYPNQVPPKSDHLLDNKDAANRVILGLSRVLETDATSLLKANKVKHTHLIGNLSHLVNEYNVIVPQNGTLIRVPEAGMRMLRDNFTFCKQIILDILNE